MDTQPSPPPTEQLTQASTPPGFEEVPIDQLFESSTNPRKRFDDLDGLADSIREKGILQPLVVRRVPRGFEVVAGHRRLRAARIAGLTTVPCAIHNLDDRQACEVQVIENVQRVDVHPLEEADGYASLLKEHGYTIEKLAAKIGRPAAYVRSRVLLASLGKDARRAFLDDKLSTGVAQLVARIPNAELQREATENLLAHGECPSVSQAGRLIQDRFMLRLEDAPFDRKSKTLLPIAGSCTDCPKRTGAQPELFADVKTKDTCTDPTCFEKKRDAHAKQKLDEAKASGKTILSASETKKVFPFPHSTHVAYAAPYVDANDHAYDVDTSGKKKWATVIKGHDIATVVAVDPVGNVRELIPREALKPIIKELGGRDSGNDKYKAEETKKREKQKLWLSATRMAIGAIVEAIEEDAGWRNESAALLALALSSIIDGADFATKHEVAKRRELYPEQKKKGGAQPQADDLLNEFAARASIEERVGLGIELLITRGAVPHHWSSKPEYGEHLCAAGKLFDVDVLAIEKELVAAKREAKKTKPKKAAAPKPTAKSAKAKPAKKGARK